jgi:hypothetical protein
MSSSKREGVWNPTLLDEEAEADLVAGLDRSGEDVIDNSYKDVLDLVPENAEEAHAPSCEPMQPSEAARLVMINVVCIRMLLGVRRQTMLSLLVGLVLWYSDGGACTAMAALVVQPAPHLNSTGGRAYRSTDWLRAAAATTAVAMST